MQTLLMSLLDFLQQNTLEILCQNCWISTTFECKYHTNFMNHWNTRLLRFHFISFHSAPTRATSLFVERERERREDKKYKTVNDMCSVYVVINLFKVKKRNSLKRMYINIVSIKCYKRRMSEFLTRLQRKTQQQPLFKICPCIIRSKFNSNEQKYYHFRLKNKVKLY